MRRSTVQSLPLQKGFPGLTITGKLGCPINEEEGRFFRSKFTENL